MFATGITDSAAPDPKPALKAAFSTEEARGRALKVELSLIEAELKKRIADCKPPEVARELPKEPPKEAPKELPKPPPQVAAIPQHKPAPPPPPP